MGNMSEELFKWVWAKGKKLSLPPLPADWLRVREAGEGAAPKRNLADMIKGGVKLRKRDKVSKSAPVDESDPLAKIKARAKYTQDSVCISDSDEASDWDESSDDGRRRLDSKRRDSPVMIRLLKEIIAAQD